MLNFLGAVGNVKLNIVDLAVIEVISMTRGKVGGGVWYKDFY